MGFAGHWGQDDFIVCMPFDKKQINRSVLAAFSLRFRLTMTPSVLCRRLGCSAWNAVPIFRSLIATRRNSPGQGGSMSQRAYPIFRYGRIPANEMEHSLLSDFQRALNSGNVTFFLQPQCDISTGRIVGAEALARWRTADWGYISPAVFVPVLERNGFVSSARPLYLEAGL